MILLHFIWKTLNSKRFIEPKLLSESFWSLAHISSITIQNADSKRLNSYGEEKKNYTQLKTVWEHRAAKRGFRLIISPSF